MADFLLIHMRKSLEAEQAEYENFLRIGHLTSKDLDSINLHTTPKWNADHLINYKGFMIGGYSDDPESKAEVTDDDYPFLETFNSILEVAKSHKIPGLMSCGGFMIGSAVLGAEVVISSALSELSFVDINLTDQGIEDILFQNTGTPFVIFSGHLKSTLDLPPDCILLGSTEKCPIHIFKTADAPIYAFQGHPEITYEEISERVRPYKSKYFKTKAAYDEFMSNRGDATESNLILRRFLDLARSAQF